VTISSHGVYSGKPVSQISTANGDSTATGSAKSMTRAAPRVKKAPATSGTADMYDSASTTGSPN